jgi:hypothetical protein
MGAEPTQERSQGMSDQDKDTLEQGEPNEFMPGEEEFDEDLEAGDEAGDEAEAGAGAESSEEPGRPGRRFGFGRSASEGEAHPQGSVRATHERVHIDDRASAVFALICAVGLVGILVGSVFVAKWPAGAPPTLPPLNLQTYSAPPATPTPVPTPTPVATPTPVPTPTPAATPTVAPTASPS